ncbi:ribonuclease H-like superfamily protein, partial [Striga asiatica]
MFIDSQVSLAITVKQPHQKVQPHIIMNILKQFNLVTGQKVKLQKSTIFFSKNTSPSTQRNICHILKLLKAKYFHSDNFFTARKTSANSWMWNTWLEVRDDFKEKARIRIQNGLSANIWDTPWLPGIPNNTPQKLSHSSSALVKVQDLFDSTRRRWNVDLLNNNFNSRDVQAILKVKELEPTKPDYLIGEGGPNITFTVKYAYDMMQQKALSRWDPPESSKDPKATTKMRKRTWKLKIKGKIKHFL